MAELHRTDAALVNWPLTSVGPGHAIEHPLPSALGICILVREFLTASECADHIAMADLRGFRSAESDYPPSYRNNERQVIDDQPLSEQLFQRLRHFAPRKLSDTDDPWKSWCLAGLNEWIRICRYNPGERFTIHQDGVHHRNDRLQSKLTFMIYLTDGDEFEGGDTVFFASGPNSLKDSKSADVIARVRPKRGTLIIFDHGIWHAGEAVTRGVKHILRSDLLYRRTDRPLADKPPKPFAGVHQGYVWSVIRLPDDRIATCGRDGQVVIWDANGIENFALKGHRQSVLGLASVGHDLVASISRDRFLRVWDLSTRTCTVRAPAHLAAGLTIARLGDGVFATGGADHDIRIWTAAGDNVATLSGHSGWVWGLVAVGQNYLASASEDGTVRLWSVADGSCVVSHQIDHPLRTIDARPSHFPDRDWLVAVGDSEGWIQLLRLGATGCKLEGRFKAHGAAVRRVRFLSNGSLASCGEDNCMRVWTSADRENVYQRWHDNFLTDVTELADGRLLSCGYDGCRLL